MFTPFHQVFLYYGFVMVLKTTQLTIKKYIAYLSKIVDNFLPFLVEYNKSEKQPEKVEKKMAKSKLEKVEEKKSLNIKISPELDARLKKARKDARDQGKRFNVSKVVEEALEKELKRVEAELAQTDMFEQ